MRLNLVRESHRHLRIEAPIRRHQIRPSILQRTPGNVTPSIGTGQMRHAILRHDHEPSVPKVFQLGHPGIEVHERRSMRDLLLLHRVSESGHDAFEDEAHEISVADEDGGAPRSRSRGEFVVASFVLLSGQGHSGIEDIAHVVLFRRLAQLLVEVFHHPNVKFGGSHLRFGTSLGSIGMRPPSVLLSTRKPLEGCIGHTRRIQKGSIDLLCIHAWLDLLARVTPFALVV
mmetsp:Transcript_17805/g.31882  ORF Transcript_17805/g.31882 Transcript_17805/m.31882 type:complete len:229 (+) Transcript_17805:475-1161(+)